MKKKELIVFQMLSLAGVFLFGMIMGVQGMLSWIWRSLNSLIIDLNQLITGEMLLKNLQETSASGMTVTFVLGALIIISAALNFFILGKKYRELLNSLEK